MSRPESPGRQVLSTALDVVAAPAFRQALTVIVFGMSLVAPFVRVMLGWPGALAALALVTIAAAASLAARRGEIEWRGILPVSLLTFMAWMIVSVFWSEYTWASIGGIAYSLAWMFLGAFVALSRDLIQVVRALGDALRAVLLASLVVEIVSGILIDAPLHFLGVAGHLAEGGPIQGIAGTRNALGFIAGLAILTFWIEFRTRSVRRTVSVPFLVLACLMVLASRSPVTFVVLAVVGLAGLLLVVLRRVPATARTTLQPIILIVAVAAAAVSWVFRVRILNFLDAASDFEARTRVWQQLSALADRHPVEGWGWVGIWPVEVFPYSSVRLPSGRAADSALNAFVDTFFQLGLIGLALLVLALGLGFARSWLVASAARSTVNVWPALTLALLGATGLAESYLIAEGGLVLAFAACIAAARKRSWRKALS
ncbi:MAG: O-antigen ligase family protein [Microbacteriaceae bacterium]|nr:O-antigen ligase family protein [Microbacteriaceae bacterium]